MAISFNSKRISVMAIIAGAVEAGVALFAGEEIMTVLAGMLNCSGTLFADVYELLGFAVTTTPTGVNCTSQGVASGTTVLDGTVDGSGSLIVVAVLIGVIVMLMGFIGLKFSMSSKY